MRLDIKYTCPDINREVGLIKKEIEDKIRLIISDLSPYIPESTVSELSEKWTVELYGSIESSFETIRETNDAIRNQFEKQSDELEEELKERQELIDELEGRIETLESIIEGLENN